MVAMLGARAWLPCPATSLDPACLIQALAFPRWTGLRSEWRKKYVGNIQLKIYICICRYTYIYIHIYIYICVYHKICLSKNVIKTKLRNMSFFGLVGGVCVHQKPANCAFPWHVCWIGPFFFAETRHNRKNQKNSQKIMKHKENH